MQSTEAISDAALIERYRQGSAEAYSQLVRRHLDWVYSVARRSVIDKHLAEDVTQAAFEVLLRRPPKLRDGAGLSPWLFGVVRLCGKQALRTESRRLRRETEAAKMMRSSIDPSESDDWVDLEPMLDELVGQLSADDRRAVLLRFYEQKNFVEVGTELGMSEDGARKRVSRAVEKLRDMMGARGVSVAALAPLLSAYAVESAPAGLHAAITSAAAAVASSGAASPTVVSHVLLKKVAAVAALFVAVGAADTWVLLQASPAAQNPSSVTAQAAPAGGTTIELAPVAAVWPLAVPGTVTGSPTPAQLDDDPELEIVVPCMQRANRLNVHQRPSLAAQVFAFNRDGTIVKGWPVVVQTEEQRIAYRKSNETYSEHWYSTPLALDIDGDGKDEIIMPAPNGKTIEDRSIRVLRHDGSMQTISLGGWRPDPWNSIAAADLDGDGHPELLGAYATVKNKMVLVKDVANLPDGFAPCVGDANGDGHPEIYLPEKTIGVDRSSVSGWDCVGQPLAGWPQKKSSNLVFPVMGDIAGDEKKEVITYNWNRGADGKQSILAWTWNGQRFGSTYVEGTGPNPAGDAADVPVSELCTSVFKDGLSGWQTVSLADLNGDSKAEVIMFDGRSLRAWRGDGTGFGNDDGIIATLPDIYGTIGVSVADLGGDGEMDFFVGTYWIRLAKDGKTQITSMMETPARTECQSVIADIDRDGKADILIGTSDGRVMIYNTGKEHRPEWVQWATWAGNFRHTGCWEAPKK